MQNHPIMSLVGASGMIKCMKISERLPEKYSLCWENDAWIEQAEKRKKADLKKQYESFFGEIAT